MYGCVPGSRFEKFFSRGISLLKKAVFNKDYQVTHFLKHKNNKFVTCVILTCEDRNDEVRSINGIDFSTMFSGTTL